MVVSEQKGVCVQFQDVARPADNLSRLQKPGDEVLDLFALSHDHDLVSVADRLVGRAVQGDNKRVLYFFGSVGLVPQIKAEGRGMGGKKCVWYSDILTSAAAWELRIRNDLSTGRVALRPPVICTLFYRIKRLVRFLQAEVVCPLPRSPEKVADPFQTDTIAQPPRKFALVRAVRVHLDNTRPHLSLSIHALQLEPTDMYNLPDGEKAIVRDRCHPPYL